MLLHGCCFFQTSESVNSEPNLTEGICQFCDIHCLQFLQIEVKALNALSK